MSNGLVMVMIRKPGKEKYEVFFARGARVNNGDGSQVLGRFNKDTGQDQWVRVEEVVFRSVRDMQEGGCVDLYKRLEEINRKVQTEGGTPAALWLKIDSKVFPHASAS